MIRPLALVLMIAGTAARADVVPLVRGTYVEAGTPCADPPFAAIRSFDGRGFADPHSRDCRARIVARKGANLVIENDCIGAGTGPAARTSDRVTLHLAGHARFTDLTAGLDYRLCPAAALPASLRQRATR